MSKFFDKLMDLERDRDPELAAELRQRFADHTQADTSEGNCRLINPEGQVALVCTVVFARTFAHGHKGWTYETL